jgi:pyruvate dehydrogenase E2 component (dihydrolipoamide acetyltransferase)
MPKLSDTMTEGQLGVWRKSVGEKIERGDIIAEVETDKATMELEAFASGILLEQRVQAGELVPVGAVIGLIGLPDEVVPADATSVKFPGLEIQPIMSHETERTITSSSPVPDQHVQRHDAQAAPIVRRRAAELGINLGNITGSGPGGRILLNDLEQLPEIKPVHDEAGGNATPDSVEGAVPASTGRDTAVEPISRMRGAIARVTAESWRTIPHFYISIEIEMGRAEKFVRDLKAEGVAVSLNAMILAAVVASLVKYPGLNATFTDKGILKYAAINLGFAVAVEGGLLVPVIRGAEYKGMRELNDVAGSLAARSRAGSIAENEISGGTFSVSNLGMHGVGSFASIIMPAQAGILAVGSVADRPTARNGSLEIGRLMAATLSCDHRIIDGVYAADFLNEFRRLLENPSELPP